MQITGGSGSVPGANQHLSLMSNELGVLETSKTECAIAQQLALYCGRYESNLTLKIRLNLSKPRFLNGSC
jgi:hypothetical protein